MTSISSVGSAWSSASLQRSAGQRTPEKLLSKLDTDQSGGVDGTELPAWEALDIRTARPAQALEHMERLLRERLARTPWRAPADMLELVAEVVLLALVHHHQQLPPSPPRPLPMPWAPHATTNTA